MGLTHVLADLGADDPAELDLGDDGQGDAGEPDGIADVVVVAVREENRVDAHRLELRGGT